MVHLYKKREKEEREKTVGMRRRDREDTFEKGGFGNMDERHEMHAFIGGLTEEGVDDTVVHSHRPQ